MKPLRTCEQRDSATDKRETVSNDCGFKQEAGTLPFFVLKGKASLSYAEMSESCAANIKGCERVAH